jgi:imidazolonepropionase-like amidohydrolase
MRHPFSNFHPDDYRDKFSNYLVILLLFCACSKKKTDAPNTIAFTGATIIDGTGLGPIKDGVLIVRNGRVVQLGVQSAVTISDGAEVIDLSGKFIMPGIINAHGHVGDVKGIEGGKYSRQNVIDNLGLYARYGVTTVVSLGGDKQEAEDLRAIRDTTATQHARLFIAGEVMTGSTPAEAVAIADRNHGMGVDFMKIRVDDNLGTATKMPEEVSRAAINRSHELGYKIATHIYYLEDARKLLGAGSDLIAHSVRDKPVDAAFVALMKEKKVCYCPTLTRELSTYVYGDTATFFSDPFFKKEYDSAIIQPLKDPARQKQIRESKSAKTYCQQLPVAMANLKTLSDAGVTIAFGTDSGIPTRFMGYFEHLELAMMADAGLTPMQIIQSATKNPAACLGLKGLGTLSRGNWADFIVLDSDPLEDIKNLRTIHKVYIGGVEVNRR